MKIRKDDKVLVISWKDKGKTGTVLKSLTKTNRLVVDWINIATKHFKKMWTSAWRIEKIEKAIDASNVMLICPFTNKPTRVWFVFIEEKSQLKKFRFSKMALKTKWGEPKDYIIK